MRRADTRSIEERLRALAEARRRSALRGVPDGRLWGDLFGPMECDAATGMPLLPPPTGAPSGSLQLIHEALRVGPAADGLCFYTADRRFAAMLRNPGKFFDLMGRFRFVVGPDFSQFADLPPARRRANALLNRRWEVAMCRRGLPLVHNATWSLPDSYQYSVAGLPAHLPIAVNSMGAASMPGLEVWLRGYSHTLRELRPRCVLRYGPRVEGEDDVLMSECAMNNEATPEVIFAGKGLRIGKRV